MRFSLLASLICALLCACSAAANAAVNPLKGRGMWIWELPSSSGGSTDAILSQAKRYGISVLMVKSSDGTGMWSQFNPEFVSAMHHAGVRVCAWQYVYGDDPVGEAQAGAQAVKD